MPQTCAQHINAQCPLLRSHMIVIIIGAISSLSSCMRVRVVCMLEFCENSTHTHTLVYTNSPHLLTSICQLVQLACRWRSISAYNLFKACAHTLEHTYAYKCTPKPTISTSMPCKIDISIFVYVRIENPARR